MANCGTTSIKDHEDYRGCMSHACCAGYFEAALNHWAQHRQNNFSRQEGYSAESAARGATVIGLALQHARTCGFTNDKVSTLRRWVILQHRLTDDVKMPSAPNGWKW